MTVIAPPGYPPPVNPDDLGRGPMVIAVTWVFTVFAMIAVSLWVYTRRKSRAALGWDVWLMIVALIIRVAQQIETTVCLKYGLGKHDRDLTPEQLVMILKFNWSTLPGGTACSVLARLSITILLIRLFGVYKAFKWFLIILISLQIVLSCILLPITYVQIKPLEALWNVFMVPTQRWDPRIWLYIAYVLLAVWTFSDLMYVLLPVAYIWKLQMPLRQRISLMLLMCVSLFTMTMSILKTIWIASASNATEATPDVQYDATYQVLFSILEMNFVIIMGCIPSLRALVSEEMGRFSSLKLSLSSFVKKGIVRKSSDSQSSDSASEKREFRHGRPGSVDNDSDLHGVPITLRTQCESRDTLVDQHGQIKVTREWNVLRSTPLRRTGDEA